MFSTYVDINYFYYLHMRNSFLKFRLVFLKHPMLRIIFFYHPSLFTVCTSTFSKLLEGSLGEGRSLSLFYN
jgi:hypothetical protein